MRIQPLNKYREKFGMEPFKSFSELTSIFTVFNLNIDFLGFTEAAHLERPKVIA